MKVIADLCVVPISVGVSVSKEIAICERILTATGLKTHLHLYGTNIESEWDRVFVQVDSFARKSNFRWADDTETIRSYLRFVISMSRRSAGGASAIYITQ